jgi:hypothetical protein
MEKMPKILSCDVVGCSYNSNKQCRALAITIGDPVASCDLSHPACDTYVALAKKGGNSASAAAVGACKVDCCKFNEKLECCAPGISVSLHTNHADCNTFQPL